MGAREQYNLPWSLRQFAKILTFSQFSKGVNSLVNDSYYSKMLSDAY